MYGIVLTHQRPWPVRGTFPKVLRPDSSHSTSTLAGSTPFFRRVSARRRPPPQRTASGRAVRSISRSVERLSRAVSPTPSSRPRRQPFPAPCARTSVARRPRGRRPDCPPSQTSQTSGPPASDAVAIETQETGSSRDSRPSLKLNTTLLWGNCSTQRASTFTASRCKTNSLLKGTTASNKKSRNATNEYVKLNSYIVKFVYNNNNRFHHLYTTLFTVRWRTTLKR